APVITLNGEATVTIEVDSTYTDALATATDNYDGDITSSIVTSGSINLSIVGTYTITYNVTDANGNTAVEVTRTVNVVDTTAPVITVTTGTDTVEQGSTWTDAGATADGSEAVTASGTVEINTVGTYIITYTATDEAGNVGTVTRTVNVVADTTAPTFVSVAVTGGTEYSANHINSPVYIVGDHIDITVTWDETVTVTGTPTLTLSNSATATYQSGTGSTALVFRYAVVEGDTDSTEWNDNHLSVSSYSGIVKDTAGNTAGAVSGDLDNVYVDANSPNLVSVTATDGTYKVGDQIVITVTWDEPIYCVGANSLRLSNGAETAPTNELTGAEYLAFTYTVEEGDTDSADLSVSLYTGIIMDWLVITQGVGNPVGAASGDLGAVIVDANSPVITVTSGTDTVESGDTWTDAGATANGGETVTASGSVDTAVVGTYTVTYNVTDAAGNTGTATRTVNVVDTTAPDILSVAATDGTFKVGDIIDITVTYNEVVSVTGTPTLTLSNGATATYTSGSGTTALVFRYTVVEGQTDSFDLSVSSYSGVIGDVAGNTAGAASGDLGAVIVDANSPVITVTSGTDTVESGNTWTDAGATADEEGYWWTGEGAVDTSVAGTYYIYYIAYDDAGNHGVAVRTVIVVDTTAPVITVTPGTDSVTLGDTWTDTGAIADGGETVTASGTVDTSTIGTYTITYTATDASGNIGTADRTVNVVAIAVGDLRAGGVVFWVDPTDNTHGLVCALEDQGYIAWGPIASDLPYVPNVAWNGGNPVGDGAEIGDGESNTYGILSSWSSPSAALVAYNHGAGWFLPSAKELNEMYINKATLEAVPGFIPFYNFYWSSTEYDSYGAWGQLFINGHYLDGLQDLANKDNTVNVRAVRAF
ncbi:DUF5011 domain-containing protein, partial [Flavobacteriaceae bacterium]|nr:DUF5011 domain-containing protein [Flavobacteriaceae bacterium]